MRSQEPKKKRGPKPERLVIDPSVAGETLDRLLRKVPIAAPEPNMVPAEKKAAKKSKRSPKK